MLFELQVNYLCQHNWSMFYSFYTTWRDHTSCFALLIPEVQMEYSRTSTPGLQLSSDQDILYYFPVPPFLPNVRIHENGTSLWHRAKERGKMAWYLSKGMNGQKAM